MRVEGRRHLQLGAGPGCSRSSWLCWAHQSRSPNQVFLVLTAPLPPWSPTLIPGPPLSSLLLPRITIRSLDGATSPASHSAEKPGSLVRNPSLSGNLATMGHPGDFLAFSCFFQFLLSKKKKSFMSGFFFPSGQCCPIEIQCKPCFKFSGRHITRRKGTQVTLLLKVFM